MNLKEFLPRFFSNKSRKIFIKCFLKEAYEKKSILYFSLNQYLIVVEEAINNRLRSFLLLRKKFLKSSEMVKSTWR